MFENCSFGLSIDILMHIQNPILKCQMWWHFLSINYIWNSLFKWKTKLVVIYDENLSTKYIITSSVGTLMMIFFFFFFFPLFLFSVWRLFLVTVSSPKVAWPPNWTSNLVSSLPILPGLVTFQAMMSPFRPNESIKAFARILNFVPKQSWLFPLMVKAYLGFYTTKKKKIVYSFTLSQVLENEPHTPSKQVMVIVLSGN